MRWCLEHVEVAYLILSSATALLVGLTKLIEYLTRRP
jgi:hypothetical protein